MPAENSSLAYRFDTDAPRTDLPRLVTTGNRASLLRLIETVVIPQLVASSSTVPAIPPRAGPPGKALARLLIAADPAAALALVGDAMAIGGSMASWATDVFEPAARSLGDLWQDDVCSEYDVTLGLMRLQALIRQFSAGTTRLPLSRSPVVLVVPQPGEGHMLGAALDAELLWRAGWDPMIDFPATGAALDRLVASTWIDALDLSLSTSFRREHRLLQLTETIAHARLASLNPGLVVVVSGRVFGGPVECDDPVHSGPDVGADASFGSASQAEAMILLALDHVGATWDSPHSPACEP